MVLQLHVDAALLNINVVSKKENCNFWRNWKGVDGVTKKKNSPERKPLSFFYDRTN